MELRIKIFPHWIFLQRDDDFGGGLEKELSEDEYDALNDETFTHATTDDWEGKDKKKRSSSGSTASSIFSHLHSLFLGGHESLVRFQNKNISDDKLEESDYDSDLDINLITKLNDFDITIDETADVRNQFQLDPSVWATPIPQKVPNVYQNNNHHSNKFAMMQPPPGLSSPSLNQQTNALQQLIGAVSTSNAPPKILSVEEIERNIINQQHQKLMQEKLAAIQSKVVQGNAVPIPSSPQQQQPPPQQQQQQIRKVQPGMMFTPPPINMNGPPQFPPVPPHLQGPNLTKFNPLMNITNHPMMNNFHPNFPPMRPPAGVPVPGVNRLPPHLMNMQGAPLIYQQQQQQQQSAQNSAQFNQRLVQEIQQNHPMLNPMFQQQQQQQKHRQYGNNHHHYNNNNNNHHHQQQQQRYHNGKMEDFDEYANLMSNRDKQFLITIQLMQLNTETPYFDDYYYTMYKERQRFRGVENESQAFRDNQMAHPFNTQSRGHAQMLLRQFNNIGKNGIQNQKNGLGRERRNSESSTKNDKENPTPRTYTPLQFENSLGKLQCGSVTAPRKIIDMEVVNNAENGQQQVASEKKSRQILMQIEMLYKIVLKLEDLQHPLAIAATIILKVNFHMIFYVSYEKKLKSLFLGET